MTREPVDAVITWVDGNDEVHADKLATYLATHGISRPESAAPTRFNECGEINYCVKSLLHFAPWIQTIYIVTSAQTPPILKQLMGTPEEGRVKIVDESELFFGFESNLPMFNSITIESLLWRIPGLSNRFIYLNDDWSIIRPVAYDDFFRDDKIVLRGHWRVQSERKLDNYWKRFLDYALKRAHSPVERDSHRVVQENSAKLAGYHRRFFQLPHAPLPAKRKTFEDFFLKYPDLLSQNVSYAFRDRKQFLPLTLAQHLDIKQKNVIFDNSLVTAYINGAHSSSDRVQHRLDCADRKNNIAFACMQSMDLASETTQKIVFEWLDKRIR